MSNKVLRDEQDLGFRFATFFDPRCGFGLIEAMDQKAGSQCRAIEHNLTPRSC